MADGIRCITERMPHSFAFFAKEWRQAADYNSEAHGIR